MDKGLDQLEICIRTFDDRRPLAERLQKECLEVFRTNVRILDTKASDPRYSEKFILLLYNTLKISSSNYFLILEDDMLFNESAFDSVKTALRQDLSHLWFSIYNTEVLNASDRISSSTYILSNFTHIPYSGAVLLHRELLKNFVEYYLLRFQEFEFRNFDVNLSKFIKDTNGFLVLRPSIFATNPKIPSALDFVNFEIIGRSFQKNPRLDPCFNFLEAHPCFGKFK